MQVYQLSEAGRSMLWSDYQAYGYGLPDLAVWHLSKAFGPIAHWRQDLTLGDLEDAHEASGRHIARTFVAILERPELAVRYFLRS
jgi:hypothetical protein